MTARAIRSWTAYWHLASASLWWLLRKKKRGSGDIEKGLSWRPKNDSYICPLRELATV